MNDTKLHSIILTKEIDTELSKWFIDAFNCKCNHLKTKICNSKEALAIDLNRHKIKRIYWHINHVPTSEALSKILLPFLSLDFVLLTNKKEKYVLEQLCKQYNPIAIWHVADLFQREFIELIQKFNIQTFQVSKSLFPIFHFPTINLDILDFKILKGIQEGNYNKQNISNLPCSESTYYEHLKKIKYLIGLENKNEVALIKTLEDQGYLSC